MLAIPVMFDLQKGANLFSNDTAPDTFRRLAQGVVIQAARDAKSGDQDAALWLLDLETSDTWFALADVDRRMVIEFIKSGCKWATRGKSKRLKKRGRRKADES